MGPHATDFASNQYLKIIVNIGQLAIRAAQGFPPFRKYVSYLSRPIGVYPPTRGGLNSLFGSNQVVPTRHIGGSPKVGCRST